MRIILCSSLMVAAAFGLSAADPKETVQAAVNALADQPNYGWVTTVEMPGSPFTPSPVHGKTQRDGLTVLSQEMPGSETLLAVVKGTNGVVQMSDGWKTAGELGPMPWERPASDGGGPPPDFNPAVMMGRMLLNSPRPTQALVDLLPQTKNLKASDDGVITGDLTEEGAKEAVSFGPRRRAGGAGQGGPPEAKNATGTVKFWVKNGMLSKYEVHGQGTMSFGGNDMEVQRTTTVAIQDAGSTKVDPPEPAKKKLGA